MQYPELEVICRMTGMGFAAVARVTEERWICCAVRDEIAFGLQPGGELKIQTTICNEIRNSGHLVAIDHVAEDEAYCSHPTPRMYGFQSYISVPVLRTDGQFFGTLCAIDPNPARVNTPETITMFKLFGELIAQHLDAQERMAVSEEALLEEKQTAQQREQFIGILGHDLRNPLNAIHGGAQVLRRLVLDEKAVRMVGVIQNSAKRMTGLIENVLDLARGRLAGGISVARVVDPGLQMMLQQVVDEVRVAYPNRLIQSDIELSEPVMCESSRIAQMLSNLLSNAVTHGDPTGPVRVRAKSDHGFFELSVSNSGQPIPAETLERLFQPFFRALPGQPEKQGLGLGLYIASEVAKAHDGVLEAASSPEETRFTFRMKNCEAS